VPRTASCLEGRVPFPHAPRASLRSQRRVGTRRQALLAPLRSYGTNPTLTLTFSQRSNGQLEVRRGTLDGPLVKNGVKITFCLVDTDQTDLVTKGSNRFYFDCNAALQGISVGWGVNYHQSTPLQELDITGAPEGVYYLTHLADPENHWKESNESNNFAWVKFSVKRQGANPKISILETSGCVSYACGSRSNP
jgi:hypothetical protein